MRKRLTQRRVRLTQRVAKVEPNPMNGLRKRSVVNAINKMLRPLTKGLFRDNNWKYVQRIWKALDRSELDWNMTDSEYMHDDQGTPSGKKWMFEIRFINERGKEATLYGVVIASGAGSVDDPLESYDIVAYVS